MSLDLLQEAYIAFQQRKEAVGAPNLDDVTSGEKDTISAYDVPAILAGTDLTMDDTTAFAAMMIEQIIEVFGTRNRAIASLFVMNPAGVTEDLVGMMGTCLQEGLLVGVLYGRLIEKKDRRDA
jgi:hypothetical protein